MLLADDRQRDALQRDLLEHAREHLQRALRGGLPVSKGKRGVEHFSASWNAVVSSDEELSELLGQNEYHIARRTVSKYREKIGIQKAKLRRKL